VPGNGEQQRGVQPTGPLVELTLPAEPSSIRTARYAISAALDGIEDVVLEDVQLLASEAIGLILLTGGGRKHEELLVVLTRNRSVVRVEVITDAGVGFEVHSPDDRTEMAWRVFSSVAPNWGISRDAGETTLWFEVGLPAG
jgi:hypothetical protein